MLERRLCEMLRPSNGYITSPQVGPRKRRDPGAWLLISTAALWTIGPN